jgi:prepilin-type N-terminal cleavage/methylation domain-containing protein
MRHHTRTDRAFTLIELLTVIAIIAILAGLLFPAIKSALVRAEVVRAQNGIANLSHAFTAYYTEYGKWPINDIAPLTTYNTYIIDQNFVALLQGANPSTPPNASGYPYPNSSGAFQTIGSATLQGNPRGIHFLDFKAADLDGTGSFVDPWKKPYYCRFDFSYTNSVQDPFTGGSVQPTNLNAGFLIWSAGPDNQYDNNGDSIPNQIPSLVNKDNVKSW